MATVTPAPNIDNLSAKENEAQKITGFPQPGSTDTGGYFLGFTASAVATTATTGALSALPTDPAGYIECIVAGNVVKIPFYNA